MSWDYRSAIADSSRAIALNPDDARAYLYRAYAKYNRYDYKGAIADASRVIALRPGHAQVYQAHRLRGFAKEGLGDKRGAEFDLRYPKEPPPLP